MSLGCLAPSLSLLAATGAIDETGHLNPAAFDFVKPGVSRADVDQRLGTPYVSSESVVAAGRIDLFADQAPTEKPTKKHAPVVTEDVHFYEYCPHKFPSLSRLFCAALFALSAVDVSAEDKRLDWRRLDVVATLDRDGRLHLVETHAMLFNGDWNGGERRFHVRLGEKIHLKRVTRIGSNGATHLLRPGDLSAVDQYAWHDSNTLRWRSRLSSDPPFANQEIIYSIEYSLDNVLRSAGDEYILNHDFAFPERSGVIERYTLRLQFDPAWVSSAHLPLSIERSSLAPGSGVVVRLPLRFSGNHQPAAVLSGTPAAVRVAIIILFLATITFLTRSFSRAERETGRFDPLPTDIVDHEWLEQNLFAHPAEVVGAAWDNRTAAPEVAAVLARMAGEGKLLTRIEKGRFWKRDELHLTLLVGREEFLGYEAALVKALFFSGDTTSTERIRERYKKTGLDLVAKIRKPVSKLASRLATGQSGRRFKGPRFLSAVIVIGIAIALLVSTGFQPAQNSVAAAVAGGIIIALFIIGLISAFDFSVRVVDLKLHALKIAIPLLLLVAGVVAFLWGIASAVPLGIPVLLGVPLLAIAAIMMMLNAARTADSTERLELRRRLAAAREWFKRELRSRHPQLDDGWFPYFLAFGLGVHVDRWFRAFGTSNASTHASFSPSSSSVGNGWTGGGGTFGGAGASGYWASAAGSLAAGVSAPGSSGSGGGSSGGSSGGGGGGGW